MNARVTPFDLTSQLVVVPGEMWGPRGERRGVRLIVAVTGIGARTGVKLRPPSVPAILVA